MAEPGGTRALENSGNYTTEPGGNDRAEMGWKLTTEPGWIKNGIRTEKTGRKCSQRDYPHEQLCNPNRNPIDAITILTRQFSSPDADARMTPGEEN